MDAVFLVDDISPLKTIPAKTAWKPVQDAPLRQTNKPPLSTSALREGVQAGSPCDGVAISIERRVPHATAWTHRADGSASPIWHRGFQRNPPRLAGRGQTIRLSSTLSQGRGAGRGEARRGGTGSPLRAKGGA
jgi:hypothetical protein